MAHTTTPTLRQATADLEAAFTRFVEALTTAADAPAGPRRPAPAPHDSGSPVFQALRQWRADQARARQMPPYIIATDAVLRAIEAAKPSSVEELGAVRGVGAQKAAQYGEDILRILAGDAPAIAA